MLFVALLNSLRNWSIKWAQQYHMTDWQRPWKWDNFPWRDAAFWKICRRKLRSRLIVIQSHYCFHQTDTVVNQLTTAATLRLDLIYSMHETIKQYYENVVANSMHKKTFILPSAKRFHACRLVYLSDKKNAQKVVNECSWNFRDG